MSAHLAAFARLSALALMLIPSLAAQYKGAEPVPKALRGGFDNITEASCREWLAVLSSDEFEGRGTGTPGYEKAANFVAGQFKAFGLKPIGEDGGYFQNVPFTRTGLDVQVSQLSVGGLTIRVDHGISFNQFGSSVDEEAEVMFVAADSENARIPDADVLNGKIVIVSAAPSRALTRQLRRARAVAVLEVVGKAPSSRASVRAGRRAGSARRGRRTRGAIARSTAEMLAAALDVDKRHVDRSFGKDEIKIATGSKKARLKLEAKTEVIGVPNVVGVVEGSDPVLKDEYVIIGSHLDHIGVSVDGKINNGADDDGSGSAGLLAVARAVVSNKPQPKRSVMFIAVCGEEMGLLGSAYYVDNPLVPIERTVCELQMDMIGRNEERGQADRPEDNVKTTHLVGSRRLSMELHELILKTNDHIGFEFEYDEEGVYTRSDHYNFAKKGIPIAFFFSGFHPDYHQPTDTIEKINFEKIANTAKLVYLVTMSVANAENRLVVDKGPLKGIEKKGLGR